MPRIRILQSVAGPDFAWAPGETIDVNAEQADKWADGVRAELVRDVAPERAASTSRAKKTT